MPPPIPPSAELERFLQALRRSRLLSRNQLDVILSEVPRHVRESVTDLGKWLVKHELLTHFQVVKLAQGTWQGLVLGPYHILSPLGRGGMGTVYLARDTRSESERNRSPALVALKILPAKRAREEERTLARFLREMDMARLVDHPHVTKTFEVGTVDGVHFIAMEYIRGISLRKQIADGGPLSVSRAARFFAEVCDGLQHAHEKGLIHRDLKPSNMMVTPNGHAKILDMGLALVADEELPTDKTIVGGQGYVVGTMDYIAPEQVDDPTAVDGRADLYSLGCSIYMALTGRPPFPGGTSVEKMKRHRNATPDLLTDLNPTIPVDFARIVDRLMEKDPERRYSAARNVRKALLRWAQEDVERPLDTDPLQTEAQVLQELEKAQANPGDFFESIPVAVFNEKARKYSHSESASSPTAHPEHSPGEAPPWQRKVNRMTFELRRMFPLWVLVLVPVLFLMIPCLAMTILLRFLMR